MFIPLTSNTCEPLTAPPHGTKGPGRDWSLNTETFSNAKGSVVPEDLVLKPLKFLPQTLDQGCRFEWCLLSSVGWLGTKSSFFKNRCHSIGFYVCWAESPWKVTKRAITWELRERGRLERWAEGRRDCGIWGDKVVKEEGCTFIFPSQSYAFGWIKRCLLRCSQFLPQGTWGTQNFCGYLCGYVWDRKRNLIESYPQRQ